jgi:predicted amidohydrolase YtcJ
VQASLSCNLNYATQSDSEFLAFIQACLDGPLSKGKGPNDFLFVLNWDRAGFITLNGKDGSVTLLDQLNTSRPIFVQSTDVHSGLINSRAIEISGLTPQTPQPDSGQIVIGPDGKLTARRAPHIFPS